MAWSTAPITQGLVVKKTSGPDVEGVVLAVSRDEDADLAKGKTRYLVCDKNNKLQWMDSSEIDDTSSEIQTPDVGKTYWPDVKVIAAGVTGLLTALGVQVVEPSADAGIGGAIASAGAALAGYFAPRKRTKVST